MGAILNSATMVGVCYSEAHMEMLYKRLEFLVFDQRQTADSPLFEPALMTIIGGKKRKGQPKAGAKKKGRKTKKAGKKDADHEGSEEEDEEGDEEAAEDEDDEGNDAGSACGEDEEPEEEEASELDSDEEESTTCQHTHAPTIIMGLTHHYEDLLLTLSDRQRSRQRKKAAEAKAGAVVPVAGEVAARRVRKFLITPYILPETHHSPTCARRRRRKPKRPLCSTS